MLAETVVCMRKTIMHTQYAFGAEFLEGRHPEGRGHRIILRIPINVVGRDSAVRIATHCGLDGPGIESHWGLEFPHPSRPAWDPPSLLYNGYRVLPGGKAAGAWR